MDNNYTEKKIIFVTGAISGGGAEKVITILANGCAELGADVSLAILRERHESYAISDKVKVYRIKSGKFKLLSRISNLRRAIKDSVADTVIPFLPLISLYTIIAGIGLRKKYVMSERGDPRISIFAKNFSGKDRVGVLFMRRLQLYRIAEHMVFQTTDARDYYCKSIRKKSVLIPNPLDCGRLPERFEGEREKRIIAAGRFSEEKNFPLLLSGFARFRKVFPEYTLTLCGDGPEGDNLKKLASDLGIADSVEFPGFCDDIHARMNRAAMYISTSNHEGISNSMLEALGMGVPTIVTDCPVGGSKMFVHTDENGILIPMNDEDSLVEGMTKIASDLGYAEKISKEAVKIRDEISSESICRRWLELA
ncbi:MAG: glycosyltransferase [Clostridia bacterium]|nr:glycosyltransferase [Clostridia bacterium]